MSAEDAILVDRENRVVGSAPRRVVRRDGLLHRASYVLIRRPGNRFLVQRRAGTKDVFPGLLDPTTGGVVRPGESYEDNALRELEEELGIAGVELIRLFDFHLEFESYRIWGRAFETFWAGGVDFRDGEVTEVLDVEPGDLEALFGTGDLIPDGEHVARRYLQSRSAL